MDNPEDNAWVFDSLVGFLHGPVWNAPLQTFIEEKSLTFEPTEIGQVPDKEEYGAIHSEYKNLVDLMLGSYMEDIGITPEQFEAACEMSKNNEGGLPLHFHQRLFEQIWAANDYAVFTRMMTQRNVELQLQALELIEQRSGSLPKFLQHEEGKDHHCEADEREAVIMEQVKKLSLEEAEKNQSEDEAALMETVASIEEIHKEKKSLQSALDNFQKRVQIAEPHSEPANTSAEFINEEKMKSTMIAENETREGFTQKKPQKEDIRQRQEYLRQQRNKLLSLKKQIREQQLVESAGDGAETSSRPRSARVAKMALSSTTAVIPAPSAPHDASLQLRKALAERLRTEVVDKL